jgi:hypothetical protein
MSSASSNSFESDLQVRHKIHKRKIQKRKIQKRKVVKQKEGVFSDGNVAMYRMLTLWAFGEEDENEEECLQRVMF